MWVALIGWLLVGLGVGLVHAPLSVMALEVTPEAKHGRVASWLQVADSAGPALELALVSVAMSAWAATATVGGAAYAPYWVIAAVLAILTVVAVTRLRPSSNAPRVRQLALSRRNGACRSGGVRRRGFRRGPNRHRGRPRVRGGRA